MVRVRQSDKLIEQLHVVNMEWRLKYRTLQTVISLETLFFSMSSLIIIVGLEIYFETGVLVIAKIKIMNRALTQGLRWDPTALSALIKYLSTENVNNKSTVFLKIDKCTISVSQYHAKTESQKPVYALLLKHIKFCQHKAGLNEAPRQGPKDKAKTKDGKVENVKSNSRQIATCHTCKQDGHSRLGK